MPFGGRQTGHVWSIWKWGGLHEGPIRCRSKPILGLQPRRHFEVDVRANGQSIWRWRTSSWICKLFWRNALRWKEEARRRPRGWSAQSPFWWRNARGWNEFWRTRNELLLFVTWAWRAIIYLFIKWTSLKTVISRRDSASCQCGGRPQKGRPKIRPINHRPKLDAHRLLQRPLQKLPVSPSSGLSFFRSDTIIPVWIKFCTFHEWRKYFKVGL